ncbi:hypothetical protein B566_EDAN000646 [Ephemera danica]|nr:hypothetical protein B566_EDAN000646 [Ephemera danica]
MIVITYTMTVSYQYEVASSTSGGFTRLLCKWRGSLYKLIYRELFLFLMAFGTLSILYRQTFTLEQKRLFEKVVVYCDKFITLIPLSFVLGFYVTYVAGRWWQQYMAIPWPDKIMHCVALYVAGEDEYGRMLRRTLMRYLNLSLILVLRSISSAVKRRLPTLDHVVESGFMTRTELEMYIAEFNEFRSKCGLLWSYDWVSIPLVYTQVVTIATYSFFLAALVGRQYVEGAPKSFQMEIDTYIPVFTILQFFFFMGLLKVAEQLINPFGDDDEDFELNWLIDRHTKVSYLGVDILMSRSPPLVKDMYFDDVDMMLPYTEAAVAYKKKTYRGSVHDMMVPEEKHAMYLPEIVEEGDHPMHTPTPRTSLINLHVGATTLSPHDDGSGGRRSERNSVSPQPAHRNGSLSMAAASSGTYVADSSAGTRRGCQLQTQAAGTSLDADLFTVLSEMDRQQREQRKPSSSSTCNTPVPRRDSNNSAYTVTTSPLLGDSLSRRSSSVASAEIDPETISISSQHGGALQRSRLRSCPKLYLIKRKHSAGKKNVRWRAITTVRPPPPSPENSVGALVEQSSSFMLQQFINPLIDMDGRDGSPSSTALNDTELTVSRSMPNIGGSSRADEIWPEPLPPPRWKKRDKSEDSEPSEHWP